FRGRARRRPARMRVHDRRRVHYSWAAGTEFWLRDDRRTGLCIARGSGRGAAPRFCDSGRDRTAGRRVAATRARGTSPFYRQPTSDALALAPRSTAATARAAGTFPGHARSHLETYSCAVPPLRGFATGVGDADGAARDSCLKERI